MKRSNLTRHRKIIDAYSAAYPHLLDLGEMALRGNRQAANLLISQVSRLAAPGGVSPQDFNNLLTAGRSS